MDAAPGAHIVTGCYNLLPGQNANLLTHTHSCSKYSDVSLVTNVYPKTQPTFNMALPIKHSCECHPLVGERIRGETCTFRNVNTASDLLQKTAPALLGDCSSTISSIYLLMQPRVPPDPTGRLLTPFDGMRKQSLHRKLQEPHTHCSTPFWLGKIPE